MTNEEYLNKTGTATRFLMHVFNKDMMYVAATAKAQADHNTKRLIELLVAVKGMIDGWIEELQAMEE